MSEVRSVMAYVEREVLMVVNSTIEEWLANLRI